MKRLLIVCGCGHATSTIAVSKIQAWLETEGLASMVKIIQSKISEEINRLDDYDVVISTTIVEDELQAKIINGLPLLTGFGTDGLYAELKKRLTA